LPVIDYIEKSHKHKYKGRETEELNSLEDALDEIDKNNVSNEDFEIARVSPEGTREILSIESIMFRCRHRGGFYIFPELSNSGSLPGKAGGLPR
jgi:hypothetical protein